LVERHRLDTRLTQFPLHPETPPEGMALAELFAGREDQLAQAHARLAALMAEAGLPFAERSHTYNRRRARDLGATRVPTYAAGGYAVVGAQPYEMLEELVTRAGAKAR
jgi:predicted DsbA family dithiol-disulfide isomerase